MATGWASPTKENLNFACLCRLLIDGGTRVLRDVFDTIHSPSTLHTVLHSATNHTLLQGLRRRRVLTVHQWDKLYPRTTAVSSGGFDVTLLFVLMRNICNLTPPPTGWDKLPAASDLSKEADLARIKWYRNEVAHITQTAVSDAHFEKSWTEISAVLIRLGGPHYKLDIDRLKVEPMDIDDVKYFIKALEETEKSIKTAIENQGQQVMEKLQDIEQKLGSQEKTFKDSEQRVMGKLEDIEGNLGSKEKTFKDNEQRVMGKLEDIEAKLGDAIKDKAGKGDKAQSNVERPTNQPAVEKDDLSSRVQEYIRKLKSSIKRLTESLPVLEGQTAVSIDDVFTNVTIQRSEKSFKKDKIGTTLKNRSEMFIWAENEDPNCRRSTNPKCILLTGKAGIGKSEFCHKMSRDWSQVGILDFKFLFLLTFHQLSFLGHEELDLCDILNRSSLLDEQSIIDEGLLQYMIENHEKVLIIFDGYDGYRYRTEITGDFETKYPNDPHHKMPVPAMIAKIMKGKILEGSVVMISSRPEEAQELKKFPFDVKCEIQGFSPLQVQEYIQKYFKDESIKKKVLDHVKMNQILLSFGRIPVMCYLMCYYLQWHMTRSETTENLPNTRSELYYEVIKVFITRHSYTEMTATEVEEILHKLAELAIYLMREKKIIFTEEDMMKSFKFSEQELTNLKKSGLFDCCPGVKKSPFDKPPLEFVFSHVTIQEFLCALGFVEKKQLPEKEGTSEVIWTFMAGLLRRKNDEKLMDQLIEKIKPQHENDISIKVLPLHCLYEYRDDELSKRVINKLHDQYCNSNGEICFVNVNDLDCLAIRYFLYIVQLLSVQQTSGHLTSTQSFIVNTLYISDSSLSPSGVSVLCESLSDSTFLTGLWLNDCGLDDECVKIIAQTLNKTRITDLSLTGNSNITAKGIRDICAVLSDCSVEGLDLSFCGLDDKCVKIIAETLHNTRITQLDLINNNITDEGVMCLCDVVSKRDCPVEVLDLSYNDKITAECKISVRKSRKLNEPNVMIHLEPSTFGDHTDYEGDKQETRRDSRKVTGSENISQAATSESDQQTLTLDVKEDFHDLSPLGVLIEVPPNAVTCRAEVTCRNLDLDYSPAPATDDETLVSYVIEFTPTSLQNPIIVTLKHCGASKKEGYETLVKALKHGKITKEWEQIEEIREDSSFAREHFKSGYIRVKVSQLTTLAVVSRVIRDSFEVTAEAGCIVRSSVCDDVTVEFPVGAVDQTCNGTMKLYRIPNHTEILDGITAFPCPLIIIDGFEGIHFKSPVKIRLPHPYPAGYPSGDVRVLCMEAPHEWKDITDQVHCIEHESFLELEVKHFSDYWPWIKKVPSTVASLLSQCLFKDPQHVCFAVFKENYPPKTDDPPLRMALVCLPNKPTKQFNPKDAMKDLEEQGRFTRLASSTSNEPMRPNDIAYIKLEGCYENSDEDIFLKLIENQVCRQEILLRKINSGGKLVISFLKRKDGDVEEKLCKICIDEREICSDRTAASPHGRRSAGSSSFFKGLSIFKSSKR